ncbi:MSMEG_0569 family flavin-dependent oxidoreductase [Phytohabitans suffuscus]|uniref:FAD-dependent oxidoreductase n=1 Tax=Phytohabitans suffuscus TaxID=624315 RepID=A0A6F8YZ00_9ACTN|nr:MSMEG_0569 family flavin-dependent oxidoreductase [Phytohabitans suffuscus]BCB91312.1 FAD-dependent oxidoreductase [Phytohabitans suffuscus]
MPDTDILGGHHRVVVVGGGQAGLAMSWHLRRRRVGHLVLERHRVGHEWRARRWDTFCLVTPNWQCQLPGFPYAGPDPHGFMGRDEVVRYLEDYAASFDPPLREGVEVTGLERTAAGVFALTTGDGTVTADQVVVATGPYHTPAVPRMAERLPAGVTQLHSSQYRGPAQLPDGAVLVVGTGQSGCQIAEDLHLAGRRVHLAVGGAPRVARFYRGRDVVAWLADMGYYDKGIDEFADADAVRFRVNHYVTGRDGGRDIDLRAFARDGMRLHGRLTAIAGGTAAFAGDLRHNLDHADAVAESIKDTIDQFIAVRGIEAPTERRYVPVWAPPSDHPSTLDLTAAGVSAVVWATGFHRDHRWVRVPVFDGRGYPTHQRGVTSCPGLYFLGLPWQHTWGSGRFSGVARDAEHLADRIAAMDRQWAVEEVRWIAGTPPERVPS